jgi:hypothetical protein
MNSGYGDFLEMLRQRVYPAKESNPDKKHNQR